jgi:hypothetical protein
MTRRSLRIDCDVPTCRNWQMVGYDDPLPRAPWRCSTCVDRDERLMVEDLERIELLRRAVVGRETEDTF